MKTKKEKTFNLNKLQIASLELTNFIKGGTEGATITVLKNGCTDPDSAFGTRDC